MSSIVVFRFWSKIVLNSFYLISFFFFLVFDNFLFCSLKISSRLKDSYSESSTSLKYLRNESNYWKYFQFCFSVHLNGFIEDFDSILKNFLDFLQLPWILGQFFGTLMVFQIFEDFSNFCEVRMITPFFWDSSDFL